MGAIYHINVDGGSTILATNVDRAFWKDFVIALTGTAGNIAASAIHGISFPAAKTAINATTTGGMATASPTVTNTNTNTNSGPCNEAGGGDLTGC